MSHSLALLLGSRQVPRWVVDALARAERDGNGIIERVLVPERSSPADPEKDFNFYLSQVRSKGCWTAVATGQKLVKRVLGPLSALERIPLSTATSVDEELIKSYKLERRSKYRYEFPESAVDALTESDVAFHWGIGILSGDVLSAPKHGVWGVHQGNIRKYRGGPPGFWEFFHGDERAGVTLQQYTEELDAGRIVAERTVDIGDAHTWRSVRRRLCAASSELLADGLGHLNEGPLDVESPDRLGPVYRPGQRTCEITVRYLGRAVPGWVRELTDL